MDKHARRELTKELALEAGYRIIKFTTGSEYLHYGRFEPDIPRDYIHIKTAQDRYLDRLIELIPAGVRSILDVGAGSGKTAEVLTGKGYKVDCVSPGRTLAAIAETRLASHGTVYRTTFQDAAIPARYDLVLFSESFQYIPMAAAIEKSLALLNPGGHILIADFFNRSPNPPSAIRGGHKYSAWRELYPRYPLELLAEQDITEETAPLHDIVQAANREVLVPLMTNSRAAALARWPWSTRILLRLFRGRIDAILKRRLSPDRTGAEFARGKIYKVYLFGVATGREARPA